MSSDDEPDEVSSDIWLIFCHYALRGNPLEPSAISVKQFTSFTNECGITGMGNVLEADVAVAFKAEVGPGGKMTFTNFLNTVAALAQRVYPSLGIEEAFQRLMADQILEFAARLAPEAVNLAEVAPLYRRFGKGLKQIFQYYASEASGEHKEGATASPASSKFNSRMN
eukprot:g4915.t1